ncbi:MAG: hypothetical protein JNK29_06430, partial [Anaerolineales bacterium]|nr:hypothetical protein [Anaerolineales bacterium]
ELKAGVSWLAAAPSVARYLWAAGQAQAAAEGKACTAFAFALGSEHPVYRVLAGRLPGEWRPYAWYVRVPDLAGFLRHLTPVLEARLARSLLSGHTGEVKLSFYRSGLQLHCAAGRLSVAPWQPRPKAEGDAAFPDLTFLHLLFGHRTLDELKHIYRDCWTDSDEARLLLEALFPKQASDLWPVY